MSLDKLPDEIPLGTVIRGDKIGSGGFGTVYKAVQHPFNATFAIKLLDPSVFNSPDSKVRERFAKEANFLLSLRHEYITPIYGVGEYEGTPYILMEYFDGVDLQKAREIGTPTPEQVLNFFECITSALDYAHRCNVFHRDIKPTNLLTKLGGDARVVDFGVSHAIDPDGERLTKEGATPVGGDAFAAPELVANPRLLDPRCDIFSLGACWFWLLTGTAPKGRNWESALRQVDGMTPKYESVMLKTLDQVDARYQTMAELLTDIRHLRSGASPAAIDGELDDDSVTTLAVVFEQCTPMTDGYSVFRLEQRVSKVMDKFTMGATLRILAKLRFIEIRELEHEHDSYFYEGACILPEGEEWVLKNRARVASLLPEARTQPPGPDDFDDDIPF